MVAEALNGGEVAPGGGVLVIIGANAGGGEGSGGGYVWYDGLPGMAPKSEMPETGLVTERLLGTLLER